MARSGWRCLLRADVPFRLFLAPFLSFPSPLSFVEVGCVTFLQSLVIFCFDLQCPSPPSFLSARAD